MEPQLFWHKYQKSLWWVAKEVINPPEDPTSRKKKPIIAAVTYFSEEDSLVRVTNPAEIVKYETDKESYIRKGLQYLKQTKSTLTESWKSDVRKAEQSINGDVNIIERIEREDQQNAKPKKSIVAEIFGTPKLKKMPSVTNPATPAKTPGRGKGGRPPLKSASPKTPQVKNEQRETPKGHLNCPKCFNFNTDKVEIFIPHFKHCVGIPAKVVKSRTPRKSTPKKETPQVAKTPTAPETPKKQRGRPRKSAGTPTQPKAYASNAPIPEPMSNNDTSLKDSVMEEWDLENEDAPKNAKPDPSSMFDKLLQRTKTTEAPADEANNELKEAAVSKINAGVDLKPEGGVPKEDDDMTAKFNEIMESTEPVKGNQSVFGDPRVERIAPTVLRTDTDTDAGELSGGICDSVTEKGTESATAKSETATRKRRRPADSTPIEQVTTNRRSTRKATEELLQELPPPTRRKRGTSKSDSQPELVHASDIPSVKAKVAPQVITYSPARGRKVSSKQATAAKQVSTSIESSKLDLAEQIPAEEQTQEPSEPVAETSQSTRTRRARQPSSVVIQQEASPRRSRRSSKLDAAVEIHTPKLERRVSGHSDESPRNHMELPRRVSESQNSEDYQKSPDLEKECEPIDVPSDSIISNEAEAASQATEQTDMPVKEKELVEAVAGEEQVALKQEGVGEILSEEVKEALDNKVNVIFAKKTLPEVNASDMEVDTCDNLSNGHLSTLENASDVPQQQQEASNILSKPKADLEMQPKVGSKRKQSFGDLSSSYGQIEMEGPTPPKQRAVVDRRGSKEVMPVVDEPKVADNVEIEDDGEDQGTIADDNIDEITIPAGEYDGKVVHVVPVEDEDGSITYMVYALDQDNDEPQEPMHQIYIEEGKNLDLTTIMQSLQAAPDEAGDSQSEGTTVPGKQVEVKTVLENPDIDSLANVENGSGTATSSLSVAEIPALTDTPSAVSTTEK